MEKKPPACQRFHVCVCVSESFWASFASATANLQQKPSNGQRIAWLNMRTLKIAAPHLGRRRFQADAAASGPTVRTEEIYHWLETSNQNLVHLGPWSEFFFSISCWSSVTPFEIAFVLGPACETLLRLAASFWESVTAPLLGLSRDLWRTLTVCLFTFGSVFELALSRFWDKWVFYELFLFPGNLYEKSVNIFMSHLWPDSSSVSSPPAGANFGRQPARLVCQAGCLFGFAGGFYTRTQHVRLVTEDDDENISALIRSMLRNYIRIIHWS